jgi:SAM-dependent methyltransferase
VLKAFIRERMNIIDKTIIHRFHEMRSNEFGEGSSQALGWVDDQSQQLRFEMLAGIGDMNGCSVLDIGCGHGDLSATLFNKYPKRHYSGIEQVETFLNIATTRYGNLPNTTFYLGDCSSAELPMADYVLASGSLSYRTSEPNFIYHMISKLFSTCRIGFGFNLLSKVNTPGGILMAYDVLDILTYCRSLSSKVVLHDEYCEGDFTVWMYK